MQQQQSDFQARQAEKRRKQLEEWRQKKARAQSAFTSIPTQSKP